MSVPVPTYTNSTILKAGQTFSLPPGGKLVAASDTTAITSSCTLGDLESLQCYAFVFGNGGDDGNDSQLFEAAGSSNVVVSGIFFNGSEHTFTSIYAQQDSGTYDLTAVINSINGTSAGQLIFDATGADYGHNDNGTMSYIVFKTTETIAKSLELVMFTYAPSFPNNDNIKFYVKPRLYADVSGYSNIPACVDENNT